MDYIGETGGANGHTRELGVRFGIEPGSLPSRRRKKGAAPAVGGTRKKKAAAARGWALASAQEGGEGRLLRWAWRNEMAKRPSRLKARRDGPFGQKQ